MGSRRIVQAGSGYSGFSANLYRPCIITASSGRPAVRWCFAGSIAVQGCRAFFTQGKSESQVRAIDAPPEPGKARMLNAAPESESGLPKIAVPTEAARSQPPANVRPEGQDVVSYLRAMVREEPEPAPEPEPRSPFRALMSRAAGAIRSASAIAGHSATPKSGSSPEPTAAEESRSVHIPVEPVAQVPVAASVEASVQAPQMQSAETPVDSPALSAPAPSSVESSVQAPQMQSAEAPVDSPPPLSEPTPTSVEPFAQARQMQSAEAPVDSPPPLSEPAPAPPLVSQPSFFAELRGRLILRLRGAAARLRLDLPGKRKQAADALSLQVSRLAAWRSVIQRAANSAQNRVKALPVAMGNGMRALRPGWAALKGSVLVAGVRMRRLQPHFSLLIARRRRAAPARAGEAAASEDETQPASNPAAATARAARPQPAQPDFPFRSAPAWSPEPVPPPSPFRPMPSAAAVPSEAAFAAGHAQGVPPMPVVGAETAGAGSTALRGEVLPPEPAPEQRVRAAEPARVINMQPGVRSAVPASGTVSRG